MQTPRARLYARTMETGSGTSILSLILRSMGLATKAADAIAKWKLKPGSTDRDLIVVHCRWLDERRVFSAPMNSEVVEMCIGSIRQARDRTAEVQAQVKDAGTRATLGGLLDLFRRFLDTWENARTPRTFDASHRTRFGDDGADLTQFFKDLGELRAHVRGLVSLLAATDARLASLPLATSGVSSEESNR